jgi:hypothetical protein
MTQKTKDRAEQIAPLKVYQPWDGEVEIEPHEPH